MTQAPSRVGEILRVRGWPTLACAPHSAQTKVANRDDATRVERCRRFAASRWFDMRARFVGRRRPTDRLSVWLFIVVVSIRRGERP
ncbi:hypothetical protein BURCENBC7_AP6284 [Burkholderia cenocepacia BC7]|nr:hypothetical protein BURCENK562V_C1939 [Burkholderia cenocepacia K56-2Valvano]ERI29902.1 hypothetical protein BURCENBC7_AP6284 [Burkholderia cenocepacia BC7]